MKILSLCIYVFTYFDETDIEPIVISSIIYIIICTVLFECTPKIDAISYLLYFVTAPLFARLLFGMYSSHCKTIYSVMYITIGFIILGIVNVLLREKRKEEEKFRIEENRKRQDEEERRQLQLIENQKIKLKQDKEFQESRTKALEDRLIILHDIEALLTECLYDIPVDFATDNSADQPTEKDMQHIALYKARRIQLFHARGLFVQLYADASIRVNY